MFGRDKLDMSFRINLLKQKSINFFGGEGGKEQVQHKLKKNESKRPIGNGKKWKAVKREKSKQEWTGTNEFDYNQMSSWGPFHH